MRQWWVYCGTYIVVMRQIVAWVSFLCVQDQLNLILQGASIVIIGSLVGIINTLFTLPFDCIKTHIQSGKAQNITQAIHQIKGIKGFYKGITPRMIQYIINAIFTLSVLEKMKYYWSMN
jgi:hypothetical protein